LGDASKAKRVLGWEPKVSFPQLVELMVLADLEAIGLDPDPILGERRTLNGLLSEDRAFIRTQLGVHYD